MQTEQAKYVYTEINILIKSVNKEIPYFER